MARAYWPSSWAAAAGWGAAGAPATTPAAASRRPHSCWPRPRRRHPWAASPDCTPTPRAHCPAAAHRWPHARGEGERRSRGEIGAGLCTCNSSSMATRARRLSISSTSAEYHEPMNPVSRPHSSTLRPAAKRTRPLSSASAVAACAAPPVSTLRWAGSAGAGANARAALVACAPAADEPAAAQPDAFFPGDVRFPPELLSAALAVAGEHDGLAPPFGER